jgi:hypothetical protein
MRLSLKLIAFTIAMFVGTARLYAQSWTTPWTASTGVVVTAAQLNQTRDNLSVLRAGGLAISGQAANRVPYASSSTQLATSSSLTFDGGTLTTSDLVVTSIGAAAAGKIGLSANTLAFLGSSSGFSWLSSGGGNIATMDASGVISTTGRINSATLQPGFLAYNSSLDACTSPCTVDLDTEVYDSASNFAADTFTAPVTGHYLLCANVEVVESAAAPAIVSVNIETTAADYLVGYQNLLAASTSMTLGGCIIAPMTATDTSFVTVTDVGATSVNGSSSRSTTFSGRLMP